MTICRKCGSELKSGALFCTKCGCKIVDLPCIPDLSLEESISLAEKLKTKYTEIKDLESEIAACEEKLSRPVPRHRVSDFSGRCFSKFLLASGIAGTISIYLFLYTWLDDDFPWPVLRNIILFGVPVAIFISGIVCAIKEGRKAEKAQCEFILEQEKKRSELKKECNELRARLNERRTDLEDSDYYIPEKLKDVHSMGKIKLLLLSGKAANLKDAVQILI